MAISYYFSRNYTTWAMLCQSEQRTIKRQNELDNTKRELLQFHSCLVRPRGVAVKHICLSRRRSWVRIPSGSLVILFVDTFPVNAPIPPKGNHKLPSPIWPEI